MKSFPLDRRFGVRHQASEPEVESIQLLPAQGEDEGGSTEQRALTFTVYLMLGAMAMACCTPLMRALWYDSKRRRTHSLIDTEELDEDL